MSLSNDFQNWVLHIILLLFCWNYRMWHRKQHQFWTKCQCLVQGACLWASRHSCTLNCWSHRRVLSRETKKRFSLHQEHKKEFIIRKYKKSTSWHLLSITVRREGTGSEGWIDWKGVDLGFARICSALLLTGSSSFKETTNMTVSFLSPPTKWGSLDFVGVASFSFFSSFFSSSERMSG